MDGSEGTASLLLVRHGPPRVEPGVAPAHWRLSASGREAVIRLRATLPPVARWYTSPERKARETAGLLTQDPVQVLEALAEARLALPFLPDERAFAAAVAAYLDGRWTPPGAEAPEQVRQRLAVALAGARPRRGETVGFVTHGRAMALWLAADAGRSAAAVWRELDLPDWRVLPVAVGLDA